MPLNLSNFEQYDVVKINKISIKLIDPIEKLFYKRHPQIDDIVTIVEIYDNPPGFELECSNNYGETVWLKSFKPNEIELEKILIKQIHVKLLNEGINVWRPVDAIFIKENVYKILKAECDSDDENWEFKPGSSVLCEEKLDDNDKMILIASEHTKINTDT